jgi:hypothetical protein
MRHMNLVSLAMQFLTPDMIGKIASGLGLDKGLAGKAITAALPSILAGMVGSSAKPDGLKALTAALGNQDPGLLGKFAGMLGGSNQASLISGGTSALSSLLGGGATGALAGAVAKYAGIGEGPSKSLLGMLAPVIMGTVAKQQQTAGLDAGGLAKMLLGQKDNIASAMPGGFAQLLSGSSLLDSIGPNLKALSGSSSATTTTTSTATKAAPANTTTASRSTASASPYAAPKKSSSMFPWLALAAVGGLGWYYYFLSGSNTPRQAAVQVGVPGAAQPMLVNGVNVGDEAKKFADNLRASLGSVKDAASAQSALPKLTGAVTEFERLKGMGASLPAGGKSSFIAMINTMMGTLEPLFATALALPGVGPLLKGPIEQIRGIAINIQKL